MPLRASRNALWRSRIAIKNALNSLYIPFSYYSSSQIRQRKGCNIQSTNPKSNSTFPNGQKELRVSSSALVTLKSAEKFVKFCVEPAADKKIKNHKTADGKRKKVKKSRRAKLKELRFFRLKAKKKMKSPNPEVRIRYKLDKAKRKEAWLIEKLRKLELPKGVEPVSDPEILTEEERFYLKRTGEKKKNYVNVGRRGVFGGVVLNMHLHWKKHETVKVVCRPCRPGQVHEYAEELARLSKGIIIDVAPNNTIVFYRGKNYVQPHVMSPPELLSKPKALEKYKMEQSLEHTGQCIEKLEMELEEYRSYVDSYKNRDSQIATDPKGFSGMYTTDQRR